MVYGELGMCWSEVVAAGRARSLGALPTTTVGLTAYGCEPHEAALFGELGPLLGVSPTVTDAPVSVSNAGLATGARCISVGHKTRVSDETLLALSQVGVEYVSTRSIGDNHIDVTYAESVGITVRNVAYSPDSVADYTLMLMLMAVRDAQSVIRRTHVHDYRLNERPGRELRDLTVGVVGAGRIGSAVIDRLRGFGCGVVAHDNQPRAAADYMSLDRLLQLSDIVTLHTPLDADTFHLLDRRRIGLMKPGAVLVNTGRGPLVDTEALADALQDGRLGGAALDVVEGEEGRFYADCSATAMTGTPLERLHRLPNVLISPHTAYFTDHAVRDAVENSIRNCLTYESRRHS